MPNPLLEDGHLEDGSEGRPGVDDESTWENVVEDPAAVRKKPGKAPRKPRKSKEAESERD